MNRVAALLLLLVGCARTSPVEPPRDAGSAGPLDGCTSQLHDGATAWSCGDGVIAMDADVGEPTDQQTTEKNLTAFVGALGKDVVSTDRAPFSVDGVQFPAARARMVADERPPFVTTMVVVARSKTTRVLTCGSKEIDRKRCDEILRLLVGRAMATP